LGVRDGADWLGSHMSGSSRRRPGFWCPVGRAQTCEQQGGMYRQW
jgi:hypothetical protein